MFVGVPPLLAGELIGLRLLWIVEDRGF